MKNVLLISLLLSSTTPSLYAQEAAVKYNELGLAGETNITGNLNGQTSLAALQFKHFGKKNIGYRLFAGFGEVQNANFNSIYSVSGDTTIERRASLKVSMPMVGAGIEGQHPLYKHVYMFAAFEVKAGYGKGHIDTSITEHYPDNIITSSPGYAEYGTARRGPGANMFFMAFSPSVGIKVPLKRITFGMEFSNPATYSNTNKPGGSSFDFDAGNINQRFFICYRF